MIGVLSRRFELGGVHSFGVSPSSAMVSAMSLIIAVALKSVSNASGAFATDGNGEQPAEFSSVMTAAGLAIEVVACATAAAAFDFAADGVDEEISFR